MAPASTGCVLRNRLQHIEARNMRRVGAALDELSRRVGFRVIPGLGERVIYRELFPKGLTLLDLAQIGDVGLSHIAARQELREMIAGFGLPQEREAAPRAAALRRLSMGALILLAAAGILWLWWSGRLKGLTYEDVAAGLIFLLGLRLLTTGRLLPGAALMAGSLLWAAWRRRPAGRAGNAGRGCPPAARSRARSKPRRDTRRPPPADRQGPSRFGRLGRARQPGQRRPRHAGRRNEPPNASRVLNPDSCHLSEVP